MRNLIFFLLVSTILSCANDNNKRVVYFSLKNFSDKTNVVDIEIYVNNEFFFYGPLYRDDLPHLYTIINYRASDTIIYLELKENKNDLRFDTLLNLKTDTSTLSISYNDTIEYRKFDPHKMAYYDSILVLAPEKRLSISFK
ncbi:MAG: hypothetical protein ACK4ND_05965 [Cytophagaceae bacterium]